MSDKAINLYYLFFVSQIDIIQTIRSFTPYLPKSFIIIFCYVGFIGMIVVFIAWRYMRQIGQRDCLNTIAVICGFISCIGICIVGNFQVTRAWTPHYVGAFMGFSVGTIYIYLATHLCYRYVKRHSGTT